MLIRRVFYPSPGTCRFLSSLSPNVVPDVASFRLSLLSLYQMSEFKDRFVFLNCRAIYDSESVFFDFIF